jgi:hypothetical protein
MQELADVVRTAEPHMSFAERRKLLELLRVKIDVLDRSRVRVSGIISEAILTLSPK